MERFEKLDGLKVCIYVESEEGRLNLANKDDLEKFKKYSANWSDKEISDFMSNINETLDKLEKEFDK
ncbi:hypothetical protein [Spiroplasma floricola]|uniref:Uncharacterized protein n=1 Tax=Spiroplasma floricola 23-6 TaxID=1336749 RepID=A0A2K8SFH5_9MOLU|nr:hypothetical protein [Spiroplasma floricola]AUB32008.1 hypothetical protein SFLOR_v1c09600 [Spiroplasma floricola 23-6]